MERKARWGVLGCAGIAEKRMLNALLSAKNAELYAIASRTQEKLDRFCSKFHPQKGYVGYGALLNDPMVDVVYIPLPNALHCEWVIKACEKGKPVLCEKPLAMTGAEVQKIYEASQRTGVPVMEAFAYFHGPVMKKVCQILAEGRLGKVRCIQANFSQIMRDPENVRLKKEIGGGAAYDMGCYLVSFARAVAGEEPETVRVLPTVGTTGVDVDVLAALQFPSGVKASLYFSFESHWYTRNTILCEYGQIDILSIFDPLDLQNKRICLTTKDMRFPEQGVTEEYILDSSAVYAMQMEQMGEVAFGRAKPAVPLEFSLGNARVMDEILGIRS